MELQQKISKVNLERHIGNQLEVMVEGITKEGKYYITRRYMDMPEIDGVIYLKNKKVLQSGEFVKCTIKSLINEYDLIAE